MGTLKFNEKEVNERMVKALDKIGKVVSNEARRICPVSKGAHKGNLRRHITHKVVPEEWKVKIGTNVPYAIYVEYGCFLPDRHCNILTKDGRKMFRHLKVGDDIIQSDGTCAKVVDKQEYEIPAGTPLYDVQVLNSRGKRKSLVVTGNHPFLVRKYNDIVWVRADELVEDDVMVQEKFVAWNKGLNKNTNAVLWGVSEKFKGRFVSEETKGKMRKNQWLKHLDRHRETKIRWRKRLGTIGNKYALGKRWKLTGDKYTRSVQKAMKNITGVLKEDWVKKKQSKSLTKFYIDNPDKHPNVHMREKGKITKPQMSLYSKIKGRYPTAVMEFPVVFEEGVRYCDVAVPELKIDFEYDGSYWHNKPEMDEERDWLFVNNGWTVVRVKEGELNGVC